MPWLYGDKNPAKRPEVREKISKKLKERWKNPDYRAKMREHQREAGRKPKGESMKKKLSETKKKQWQDPKFREKMVKAIRRGIKNRAPLIGDKNPAKRPEVRKKISEKLRGISKPYLCGENNPSKRPEIREKISRVLSKVMKKLWSSKEFRDKQLQILLESQKRKPTSIEKRVIKIIKRYGLPFKYVGDGKCFIAGKVPDFISCNGKRKLIEVAGDYWHTPEEMEERKKYFARYGFKTLVIWEHELNKYTDEEIAEKIKIFNNC